MGEGEYSVSDVTDDYIALYEYNCYNQLVYANTDGVISTYTYAPDGLRTSKTVGDVVTMFVYDNANIIEEIVGADTNKYYRGIGIIKNGDGLYYLYNGQGDVAMLTNADGEVVASYTFDAYGNAQQENTVYNPFGYRGEYSDRETGFIYLRARYYDPSTGRFINEDPIRDGLNWYVYCGNNPIVFVDPWGLMIQLYGTNEERREIFGYLQSLTRDTLKLMLDEDYNWWVYYESNDGNAKETGTKLIRELVQNKHTATIQMYNGEDGTIIKAVSTEDAMNPQKGSDVNIFLTTKNEYAYVEGMEKEIIPMQIKLGHELVHAIRYMKGQRIDKNHSKVSYGVYFYNRRGNEFVGYDLREELETVGISYIDHLGRIVKASNYAYTENALRSEQGYKKRIRYL